MGRNTMLTTLVALACCVASAVAAEKTSAPSAERGKEAVWSVASPISMSVNSSNTIWKQWGLADRPQDFDKLAQDRYGLLPSTRRDDRFPLGLNEMKTVVGPVLSNNCLLCHAEFIKQQEAVLADIREYLLTLEAPKYPFAIDRALAARGEPVFVKNCAECHGTYGADRHYPNRIVPVGEVGTDPALATFDGSSDRNAYTTLQTRNGGDVNVGRKLGTHLTSAGFVNCQMSTQYEVYPSLPLIGEYLAIQRERAGDSASAATFRKWSQQSGGMLAQCWVSCLAQAPTPNSAFKSISKKEANN